MTLFGSHRSMRLRSRSGRAKGLRRLTRRQERIGLAMFGPGRSTYPKESLDRRHDFGGEIRVLRPGDRGDVGRARNGHTPRNKMRNRDRRITRLESPLRVAAGKHHPGDPDPPAFHGQSEFGNGAQFIGSSRHRVCGPWMVAPNTGVADPGGAPKVCEWPAASRLPLYSLPTPRAKPWRTRVLLQKNPKTGHLRTSAVTYSFRGDASETVSADVPNRHVSLTGKMRVASPSLTASNNSKDSA
jgi:hypothetical protein